MNIVKREQWIDILKGLGIIFVIIGHSHRPDIILKLIQSFHMMLFFMISGYLYKHDPSVKFSEFIKKKAGAYLKPYLLYGILNYVIWMLYRFAMNDSPEKLKQMAFRYILGLAYSRGTWYWMPNCSPLWFLTAIFVAALLFRFIMNQNTRLQLVLVLLCAIVACFICKSSLFQTPIFSKETLGLGLSFKQNKLPWNIDSALWAIPFMYIGYQIKSFKLPDSFKRSSTVFRLTILTLLIIAGLIAAIYNPVDYMSMDSMICGNIILSYISSVSLSIGFGIISLVFISEKSLVGRYLTLMGRNTIHILGLNYMVNEIIYKLYDGSWMIQCLLQILVLSLIVLVIHRLKPH